MATGGTRQPQASRFSSDWLLPVAAVSVVFVMLVPLPAWVLDILLAASITASVLVLVSAIQILRPVQFSVFPMLLLLMTLMRLSLNISTSRRILLHGNEGVSAAGHVIEAFGQFVVGGNYVVGFVIFLILIAVQYLVVNHGAVRTAEVTARFTLDALPGKQMAIDADLSSGLIDEAGARERRQEVAREAEFYGAMDGAARFNQRDALATILITAIDIVAGFLIGVFQLGIPFREAIRTYTILTVGDGLVTMIPSLLVAVAGGLVVTRASSDLGAGEDLGRQLFGRSRPLWIASGVMLLLGVIPGLPKVSFFLLAMGVGFLAWRLQQEEDFAEEESGREAAAAPEMTLARDQFDSLLKLDDLGLEVGYGLVPLVDEEQDGQLLGRIRALRRHLARQMGFVVPPIHITDSAHLKPREYLIRLRGVEVARWHMFEDRLLAISSEAPAPPLEGIDTHEPAFGSDAKWIVPNLQEQALAAGFAVFDQTAAVATHLAEVVRQHAHELLTRQEVQRLLDAQSESHPKLVEELVPGVMTLGEVQRVLQQLLREQVSVRDLAAILETLLELAPVDKDPVGLVESVRQTLGRRLVHPLLAEDGKLNVLVLDPTLEDQIQQTFQPEGPPPEPSTAQPSFLRRLLEGLQALVGEQGRMTSPVLLCRSPARFHLRRLLEPFLPRVVVLSPAEIPSVISIQSQGIVR